MICLWAFISLSRKSLLENSPRVPVYFPILNIVLLQAQAGLTSTTEFLKLAEQFSNETNYTVWNDLTSNMSSLSKLLQNTGFYSSFQAFCVKLYENIAQKVGWDPKVGEGNRQNKFSDLLTFVYF